MTRGGRAEAGRASRRRRQASWDVRGVYSKRGGPHGGRGVAEPHGQHGGLGFRGKTKLGEERGVPRPLRAEAVTGKGPPCGPVRGPSPLRWSRRSPKEGRRLPGRGARDRRCCAETPSRTAQSGRGAGPSPSGLLFSCSSAPPLFAKDPSRPEQPFWKGLCPGREGRPQGRGEDAAREAERPGLRGVGRLGPGVRLQP